MIVSVGEVSLEIPKIVMKVWFLAGDKVVMMASSLAGNTIVIKVFLLSNFDHKE